MTSYKLLETYSNKTREFKSDDLDNLAKEFKSFLVESIYSDILKTNIKDQKTNQRIKDNINKRIKTDLNELTIPYYEILENINLGIEVMMVEEQVSFDSEKKFGEVKLTDILESGIRKSKPVNRFALSESFFKDYLTKIVNKWSDDVTIDHETIKILFN